VEKAPRPSRPPGTARSRGAGNRTTPRRREFGVRCRAVRAEVPLTMRSLGTAVLHRPTPRKDRRCPKPHLGFRMCFSSSASTPACARCPDVHTCHDERSRTRAGAASALARGARRRERAAAAAQRKRRRESGSSEGSEKGREPQISPISRTGLARDVVTACGPGNHSFRCVFVCFCVRVSPPCDREIYRQDAEAVQRGRRRHRSARIRRSPIATSSPRCWSRAKASRGRCSASSACRCG